MQIAVLFSDPNFLAIGLLENLLSKNCFVNVVTKDPKKWRSKTTYLSGNSRFSIIEQKKFNAEKFSYSLILSGFSEGEPYENINEIFHNFNLESSKNLIIVPFEKYSFEKTSELIIPDNIGVIYLGDLIGPRMDLDSDLLAPQLVNSIFYKRKIKLGVGEVIYPIFIWDVVKTLSKWLFSFGPYGKESILLGPQVSGSDFWKVNASLINEIKISYDGKIPVRKIPRGVEIKNIPCDLRFGLTETYRWLSTNPPASQPKILKPKPKTPKPKKKYPKFLKPLISAVLIIFLFPLLMLSVSGGFFFLSYKQFLGGNDKKSEDFLLLSKTFSVMSREESRALSLIPVFGKVYKEASYTSEVMARASDLGVSAIPVFRTASNLTEKIFGNSVYDPTKDAEQLKGGLEDLYREISLLQADTNSASEQNLASARLLNNKVNLEKFKNLTLYGKTIAQDLPSILGKGQTKTYLVLFQNNMELRPTGGFIGSFGILTFDGGRITDLTINDVYSADGQLNGHVEPPAPIKAYLGEANWWLRDSNWDPDFPTSAKRAEWFLDKEVGRSVDGVFAIDLDPVKNILKYTGPVFLPDYQMNISTENLYERTQEEVQDNFFPGSRKKASFLTALSRSLLAEVAKLNSSQKMGIIKTFYTDLDERHIQMFLHDDQLQGAIGALSWDGAVSVPSCGEACYPDFVGEVEANVGVNKSNYFLERRQEMAVKIAQKSIERTLDITLKNNSNPSLGLAGKYKSYVRIFIPEDAILTSATLFTGETGQALSPDIADYKTGKEVGVLVEVLGSQSKRLEFKWRSSYGENDVYGKYGIYVRKQAGVGDDPFSLTVNGTKLYNSSLVDDYFGRFTLK